MEDILKEGGIHIGVGELIRPHNEILSIDDFKLFNLRTALLYQLISIKHL